MSHGDQMPETPPLVDATSALRGPGVAADATPPPAAAGGSAEAGRQVGSHPASDGATAPVTPAGGPGDAAETAALAAKASMGPASAGVASEGGLGHPGTQATPEAGLGHPSPEGASEAGGVPASAEVTSEAGLGHLRSEVTSEVGSGDVAGGLASADDGPSRVGPRLVRRVVCGYRLGWLGSDWLRTWRRLENALAGASLNVRGTLAPLEDLPSDTDILVVPPVLREAARAAAPPNTPILVTPAAAAAGAFADLVSRLEQGTEFSADRMQQAGVTTA